MPTKNHGRMAQDMKRELIAIIGEMKDPRVTGGLLTVTRLDVTPTLTRPRFTSALWAVRAARSRCQALNKASGHVRTEVSRRMHIRKGTTLLYSLKMKAQPMPRTSTSCWVSWTLHPTLMQSKPCTRLEKRNL